MVAPEYSYIRIVNTRHATGSCLISQLRKSRIPQHIDFTSATGLGANSILSSVRTAMPHLLALFRTRLECFLLQHQHRMQRYLLPTQNRFSTLRRIGYGSVDLFILILVFHVDKITAGYDYAHKQAVRFRNCCHVIRRNVSRRLVTALELATNILVDFVVSALNSVGVLFGRWSNVFHTYGARALHYLAMPPYLVPTLVVLYMISFMSKYDIPSLPVGIRLPEYLSLDPSIDHSDGILTSLAWIHRPHFAIIAIAFVGSLLCTAMNALCQAVADILKRVAAATRPHWQPYKDYLRQIWNAIQERMRQEIAQMRAVASIYLDFITPAIHAAIASIWRQVVAQSSMLTIAMIFGLSSVVSTSNCDCANILTSLITTAVDRDVSLLSLAFSSIRLAASICIWLANCFVLLHNKLEELVFEDKQGAWAARADWLEGCMCTTVVAAVFYAALFLGRRMWNSDICGPNRDAVARDQQCIAAGMSVDIDGSDAALDSDKGSDNNEPITPTDLAISPGGARELQQDDFARCGGHEDVSDVLGATL